MEAGDLLWGRLKGTTERKRRRDDDVHKQFEA